MTVFFPSETKKARKKLNILLSSERKDHSTRNSKSWENILQAWKWIKDLLRWRISQSLSTSIYVPKRAAKGNYLLRKEITQKENWNFKKEDRGLLRWSSVWESTLQCRDTSSVPVLGKPHLLGSPTPVHHNYGAQALESMSCNYWSHVTYSPCSATREAATMGSPHTATKSSSYSLQLEKACMQQWRPATV